MNFDQFTLAKLRALLRPIDAADEARGALAAPMDAARSAAERLQRELADVDRRIAATAVAPIAPIPADPDRIEALIAGADVPKIDPKEVEAHAAAAAKAATKARALNAERQQIAADLAAVRQRIVQLETQVGGFWQQRATAERSLIVALGDAYGKAYRAAIIEFIATNIPPLLTVAEKVREQTGALPDWYYHVQNGLAVNWPDESYVPVANAPVFGSRMLHVWPRHDGTLLSGEPSRPPGMLEQLIDGIRSSGDPAEADQAQAAE